MNVRFRRLRRSENIRRMVRENSVSTADLLYPLFVTESGQTEEISSMPGVWRYALEDLSAAAGRVVAAGVPGVVLFGLPEAKDDEGSGAYRSDGVIPRAIQLLRAEFGESLILVPDVCLCEYTSHGHCGAVENGEIHNDRTVDLLAHASVVYADAGADIIAPSDMMDGRVAAIRQALDAAGHSQVSIMSYSAKFASGFYGPFREAADCAPQFGDRRSYQMDPANRREAMREMEADEAEGADILMVKPGLAYLDLVREARDRFDCPIAVYNVSGEYSMVKAAAANGWIDEQRIVTEILTGFKRAGADIIVTYHALDYARWNA